jgi:hypothetical protein
MILVKEKQIAASWRRHKHKAWRWIGFKLLLSLAAAILCWPIFYVCFVYLMPRMQALSGSGQPPSPELFRTLVSFYALFGLPILLVVFITSLLTNFVLPSIALEDTTVREGLRRFMRLISAETGAFSMFALLKAGLGIAGLAAAEMVIVIGEILCLIPIGIVAVAGWFLLRSAGGAGHIAMLGGAVVLLLIFMACMVYGATLLLGALHIFFQAYAMYFLGGRYPMLGNMLEPEVWTPVHVPAPVPPPPPPLVIDPLPGSG